MPVYSKNMHKKTLALFTGIAFIFSLLLSIASATHLGSGETWVYTEDIAGENKGFTLTVKSAGPQYHSCNGFTYFTYDDPCANNRYNYANNYAYDSRSRYRMQRYSRSYSAQPIDRAFDTFQADSQAATDYELKKLILKKTRGYGYSPYSRGVVYGYGFDGFYSRPYYYW